jgi:hypothetical protein
LKGRCAACEPPDALDDLTEEAARLRELLHADVSTLWAE